MQPAPRDHRDNVHMLHRKPPPTEPLGPALTILTNPAIGDRAVRLYSIIHWYTMRDQPHPPLAQLAIILERDMNYINRGLKECVQAGLLAAHRINGVMVQYELVPLDEIRPQDVMTRPKGTGYREDFHRLYELWPFKGNEGKAWGQFQRLRPSIEEVAVMADAIIAQHDGIPGDRIKFAGYFEHWLANRGWEQPTNLMRDKWADLSKSRLRRPSAESMRPAGLCQKCGTRRVMSPGDTICQPCMIGR